MQTPEREKHFNHLVRKYLESRASREEEDFLTRYYRYFDREELFSSSLQEEEKKNIESRMLGNLRRKISGLQVVSPRHRINKVFLRVAAAVTLLLILVGGLYIYRHQPLPPEGLSVKQVHGSSKDIQPGGNKAILTLASGERIALDSTRSGIIARQGASKVMKHGNNQLTYSDSGHGEDEIAFNTITTPRGGQYSLILSDGTKVWLNSASSLKFPIAFSNGKREVTLTGEAYFEVAHVDHRPFRVHAGSLEVEDIGTHFDIMAYQDEAAVKTTVLEGAVRVSRGKQSRLLRPGEQAIVGGENSATILVRKEDSEDAIAWKNGYFSFNSTEITEIMKQISRWYDVNIVYRDSIRGYLNGHIRRSVTISHVLEMLELTGEIKFRIEGRNIIVKKYF